MTEPHNVHALEQNWAQANALLDEVLKALIVDVPILAEATGLSDGSVVYEHARMYFRVQDSVSPMNILTTEILCAAAFTRLALKGREIDISELEKGLNT